MSIFKKKERKLTPREAKFFQILSKDPTKTIAQAGREAGYAENTVVGTLYNKLAKTSNPLTQAMEKAGLTSDYIAKKIHEGTNAFRTTVHQEKQLNGEFSYHKENMVDFHSRKEYLELIGKFNHSFVNKIEAKIAGIICNIDKKDYKKIREEMLENDNC